MHGGFGSWLHWVRNIEPLARRYRVLAVDLPGLGDSALPEEPVSPGALGAPVARGLERLQGMRPDDFKQIVREQSILLAADRNRALDSLPSLLPTAEERREVFEAAQRIAIADRELEQEEEVLLARIRQVLEIEAH